MIENIPTLLVSVGNDTMVWFQSLSAQLSSSHIFGTLGILAIGLVAGLAKSKESNMKFLHLFHKEVEFGNIEGYDDIKDLVRRALDSDENYNLLLYGPPASLGFIPFYSCHKLLVSVVYGISQIL
jgi:hypothetical protein